MHIGVVIMAWSEHCEAQLYVSVCWKCWKSGPQGPNHCEGQNKELLSSTSGEVVLNS